MIAHHIGQALLVAMAITSLDVIRAEITPQWRRILTLAAGAL